MIYLTQSLREVGCWLCVKSHGDGHGPSDDVKPLMFKTPLTNCVILRVEEKFDQLCEMATAELN